MDYVGEALALGIDTLVVGMCFKMYLRTRNTIKLIEDIPEVLEVGPDLQQLVASQPGQQVPYAAVSGAVRAVGKPLRCMNAPEVSAVVQKLSVKEHVVSRGAMGFWADQERTLQNTVNVVPFSLTGKRGVSVEVVDVLAADMLDLESISDHFEPSAPGLANHLLGFFTGVRQRGLQSTEHVLREGAHLTGVGMLSFRDKSGGLHLSPPVDGTPFYLTAMSLHSLARHLERERRVYKWLAITFGAVGAVIAAIMVRRWWVNEARRAASDAARAASEANRRERRRARGDHDTVPEALLCVVCRLRERELVLLPCGHVCLCEECGDAVGSQCPVCRAHIDTRSRAYMA